MSPVDPEKYALYLGVMAVLAVTPGPANLFAIATGAQRGARAGLIGVAGMNAATLAWFFAAGAGLAAAVTAFGGMFHLIALAGGLYVAWLGVRALSAAIKGGEGEIERGRPAAVGAAFRDGFAVQISNPKAVLFFTAVLPPFLDLSRPLAAQLAMFAAATIVMDAAAMSAYAVLGGGLAAQMASPGGRRAFNALSGALLLIVAALVILRAH
ncbi:MAG: LysE family translocator [Alphaproteobacteria bacterium]|nr:LysE family translocator [Alphaproteobacteria bacterium]